MAEQGRVGGPVSLTISLTDHTKVSALISTIRGTVVHSADSVRVSIRGTRSAVVNVLNQVGDPAVAVSAAFSLKGDRPPGAG